MPSFQTFPLNPQQARAELHKLGFYEPSDLPLEGAYNFYPGLMFVFLDSGVDGDGVVWEVQRECRDRDLYTLCNKLEDVDRPEPEFEIEQQAMTDPRVFAKFMRDKRRAERSTLNDGPTSERGGLTCFGCKHLSKRMVKPGLHPVYHHFCNNPKLQGAHFIGSDDRTPNWCPARKA